MQLQRKEADTT